VDRYELPSGEVRVDYLVEFGDGSSTELSEEHLEPVRAV